MTTWTVEPTYKKSITEVQTWTKDDKTITYSLGWRWGSFTYETENDNPPDIQEGTNLFFVDGAELFDWETTDGCWEEYEYDNMTDAEIEEVQQFIEENGSVYDLEEQGWYNNDTDMILGCEPEITKVEE